MLRKNVTVSMWEDSQVLRIPVEISRELGISVNDEVILEIRENVLMMTKVDVANERSIEYLFKDYSKEKFRTELTNPSEPVGEEKW